jgi:hypothetical protein
MRGPLLVPIEFKPGAPAQLSDRPWRGVPSPLLGLDCFQISDHDRRSPLRGVESAAKGNRLSVTPPEAALADPLSEKPSPLPMAHRVSTGLPVRLPWSCPGLPSAVSLAAAGRDSNVPTALDTLSLSIDNFEYGM